MYSKLVISLAIAFVIAQQVVCDTQPSTQQATQHSSPGAIAAARKIRLLTMNPGVIKLYRMLGSSGLRQSLDDEDLISDDDSYFQKRQYDDYGHMRFGKRNPKDFDDYGHMRFGK